MHPPAVIFIFTARSFLTAGNLGLGLDRHLSHSQLSVMLTCQDQDGFRDRPNGNRPLELDPAGFLILTTVPRMPTTTTFYWVTKGNVWNKSLSIRAFWETRISNSCDIKGRGSALSKTNILPYLSTICAFLRLRFLSAETL
ncbi:hypothetical protein SLA2020_103410 [Shorea laevis]